MKIVYDSQALTMQRFGGVSRYFYEIITNMERMESDADITLPVVCADNYYFNSYVKCFRNLPRGKYFLNKKILLMYLQLYGKKVDIFHPTNYDLEYMTGCKYLRKDAKIIITIHDMIHEKIMTSERETIKNKKEMIEKADGIITVSECTKKDLLEIYPTVDEKKVTVIYHGNSMVDYGDIKEIGNLPKQYILFVGNRNGYKNFMQLLNSFAEITKRFPDLYLLCVGGGVFSKEEKKIIASKKIEEKVLQKSLSDKDLFWAYKNAKCFVFPSQYEGFGIPILEAFQAKCPTILSNCSCFPEVAGDAALYFDVDKENDLIEKIVELIENENFRQELIHRGNERLKKFSWEKAAMQTYNFYQYILNLEK